MTIPYYMVIYNQHGTNVAFASRDVTRIVYKLQELRKQRIFAYIEYGLDELAVEGKAL